MIQLFDSGINVLGGGNQYQLSAIKLDQLLMGLKKNLSQSYHATKKTM
jgi:hypothetical protein